MSRDSGEVQDKAPPAGPVLVAEGRFALFEAPDGGRVIRYTVMIGDDSSTDDGMAYGPEEFLALPAELVPALEMLRANPSVLLNIASSPAGALARRMAKRMAEANGG